MVLRLLVFVIFMSAPIAAQTPNVLFEQGNELYRNKQYDEAIEKYNEVLELGYESAVLYYNLGNTFYRLDNIGYAILFYEKALTLDPSNEDIIHNLKIAKQNTIDEVEQIPQFFLWSWWDWIVSLFSIDYWLIVTYAFFIIILLLFSVIITSRSYGRRKLALVAVFPVIFFFLLSAGLFYARFDKDIHQKRGVVVVEAANGKSSPDFNSLDAFIIHAGLKVKVVDSFEDWYKIRLEDGKIGWILKEDLALI